MKKTTSLVWFIVAISLCLAAVSQTLPGQKASRVSGTNASSSEAEKSDEYHRKMAAALAKSQAEYEEKLHNPVLTTNRPPSQWPFPNYKAGPLRPLPIQVNFYCMNDHNPTYLLCEYDVDEKSYDPANERKWFKAALKQVRHSGPKKFPPIQWVAVMIVNRAESKDVSSAEGACKVAAIFKANDVFSHWRRLSPLIAQAQMDRHPFKYDRSQPTPGEQQRWVMVERHSATNRTATSTEKH